MIRLNEDTRKCDSRLSHDGWYKFGRPGKTSFPGDFEREF